MRNSTRPSSPNDARHSTDLYQLSTMARPTGPNLTASASDSEEAYVSTRAARQQLRRERRARAARRPRVSRRLALVAVLAACTAWVVPRTGSDPRRVSREFYF